MSSLRMDVHRMIGLGTIATAFVVAQVLVWMEDRIGALTRRLGMPEA